MTHIDHYVLRRTKKPTKRRAVKSAAQRVEAEPEPETVVENKRASVSDDEEFSDFSF